MSNKHFIGKRLFSFSDNGLRDPVSRVTLLVDDNNSVTAGDDTGLELLANCPYADDTLAQALLNQVKGYQYRAFNAQSADLDPAAELGDGVTADGVYSILASLTDKGDGYPDLAAPGDREEEDEYPEGGPMTRLFNRQLATTRSLIAKNSESVQILVERTDGVEEEISYIQVNLEGITQRVQDAEGNIGALELTATQLTAQIAGKIDGTDAQALIDLSLDGLTLSVSNGATSSTISLKAGDTTIDSATVKFTGVVTFTALGREPTGTTTINGGWLKGERLEGNTVVGGEFWDDDETGRLRLAREGIGSDSDETFPWLIYDAKNNKDQTVDLFTIAPANVAFDMIVMSMGGTAVLYTVGDTVYPTSAWDFSGVTATAVFG